MKTEIACEEDDSQHHRSAEQHVDQRRPTSLRIVDIWKHIDGRDIEESATAEEHHEAEQVRIEVLHQSVGEDDHDRSRQRENEHISKR